MLVTTHTITGGVVGEIVSNPILAFVMGTILHFVFDAIPHYDKTDDGKWSWRQILLVVLDFSATLYILFLIRPTLSFASPFWWGAFGGFWPDLIDNVPFWGPFVIKTKLGKKYHKFHEGLHKVQPSFLAGMIIQIAIIAVVLVIHFSL